MPGQPTYGFDTGPANVLMDAWCALKTGKAFDADGRWASSGRALEPLLAQMQREPYLHLPYPKSTGRELFHMDWVQEQLRASGNIAAADEDVMRTLLEFSVRSVADAVTRVGSGTGELYVCGGAAMNAFFMRRLAESLPRWSVQSTAARGIAPDQVEAIAFAGFARSTVLGLTANVPSVTGASRACILGAVYAV